MNPPLDGDLPQVFITAPANMIGGIEASWQAVWTASTGPYKVVWDFGGGAEPNTIAINDVTATTSTAAATMVNASDTLAATYTFTVTVTNSLGYNLVKTYTYTVGPAPSSPVITSAVYNEDTRSLTVEVDADERALPVTVSLGPSSGITAEEYTATLTEAPLVAEFALDLWHQRGEWHRECHGHGRRRGLGSGVRARIHHAHHAGSGLG